MYVVNMVVVLMEGFVHMPFAGPLPPEAGPVTIVGVNPQVRHREALAELAEEEG